MSILKNLFFIYLTYLVVKIIASEELLDNEDENFIITEPDMYDWSKHPCKRTCKDDEPSRICRYIFVVEQYRTMSKACYDCPLNKTDCSRTHCLPGDGQSKTVVVANRRLPGPTIEVCLGDTIFVEVKNKLRAETATIHWHGLRQKGSPYMDGVPRITQCAIAPGEIFQYSFNASESGTFFWHSHVGALRVDGLTGTLIIRSSPKHEVHRNLYEVDEHHMLIMDWMVSSSGTSLTTEYHDKPIMRPDTFLINGLGRNRRFYSSNSETPIYTPDTVYNVEQGKRYRFRMIDGGGMACPIEMSIDGHSLLVIGMDGNAIEPVEADVISIWPGERVDFVIVANQTVGNYWVRYRGYDKCKPTNNTSNDGIYQVAILRYNGASEKEPEEPIGYEIPTITESTRVFNPYNQGTESPNQANIYISKLKSIEENDETAKENADIQLFMNYDNYPLDNGNYHRKNYYGYHQVPSDRAAGSLQLRHINFVMPRFPVLSQPDMINEKTFCNLTWNTPKTDCYKEQCSCTQLIEIPLNKVVELVLIDEGQHEVVNHAFHLHGNFFRVVAEENLSGPVTIERFKKLDKEGKIPRNLKGAPLKDTMKVPGGGYVVIRFIADNPGYWFFHCHFEQHTANGMALLFKVGEHSDLPPVPKGFPRCGGWIPEPQRPFIASELKD